MVRIGAGLMVEADARQKRHRVALGLGPALPEDLRRREHHIFQHRHMGEEIEALEDDPDVAAQRVRRAVAVGARRARDEHPDEAQLLKAQAAKKARHLSIRRLVEKAPHVLLALRPCWAMSPLVVSKVLPVVRLFDLVVFDEASQIKPNDAIASIARGRSIVVAGDDKQLPPTNFFDRMLDGSDENDDDGETSELQHFESILTRMRGLLQRQVTLRWHYRSRDERPISFANHFVYGDDLVTFPGAFKDTPVTLDVRVRPDRGWPRRRRSTLPARTTTGRACGRGRPSCRWWPGSVSRAVAPERKVGRRQAGVPHLAWLFAGRLSSALAQEKPCAEFASHSFCL